MNRRLALALLVLLLSTAPTVALAGADVDPAARPAAAEWLQKVDTSNYSGSWETAALMFKSAVSVQAWEKAAQSVRAPLGALRKRAERSATASSVLPGAPDGKYVVFQYDAVFENKATAVETLTLAQDRDGMWRVAGYFIK
ncbi:DUF4019 domain-containing protein [Piscinibacter sakaiensis]|uniref:DUF4019 domain-containing protein n=1 Tax=Piscinibacter sakaiensis TaxID=1547922 RepID=UPI003AAF09DD